MMILKNYTDSGNVFLDMLFRRYAEKPMTILIITHDYSMISEIHGAHSQMKNNDEPLNGLDFESIKKVLFILGKTI